MIDVMGQSVINQEFPSEIKAIYLMKWIKESVGMIHLVYVKGELV